MSSMIDIDSFDDVIRYSGLGGFVAIEFASQQLHQICIRPGLLRTLCEDVGATVTHTHCSMKQLKQVCFLASSFPGEAWLLGTTQATDNFIKHGLSAISVLPADAEPWLRTSSFGVTPEEARHLTSMIEGLERNPDTWQPLPDAPHIDAEHELYIQLQAPLSFELAGVSITFGFVDLYITWEAGELLLCVGVSINSGLLDVLTERLRSLLHELVQNRYAILFPIDHRNGIDNTLQRPLGGGIRLAGFGFGYMWLGGCRGEDRPEILVILRSLVSEGQMRCLLALQKNQTATA